MRAPVVDLAGEPAFGEGDEPLGAHVGRGADRAGATHQDGGEEERVVAAEHREVARRAGEDLERVGIERADRLLHAGDVGRVRQLQHARRPEVAPGAHGDVVDDDGNRAGGGHRFEVRDHAGFRRAHVVRHHDERRHQCGRARQCLDRGDRLGRAVGAGADDELRVALGAHPRARVDHRALLGGVERRRLSRGTERHDPGAPRVEVLVHELLDGVDGDGAIGRERGDERDVHALEQPTASHGREGTATASSRARRNTSSSIGSVSRPVNVFCWLGW